MPGRRHREPQVAVVRPDRIGDTVILTAFLREVRRAYPNHRIVGVFRSSASAVLGSESYVDETILFPDESAARRTLAKRLSFLKTTLATVGRLASSGRYDIVFNMPVQRRFDSAFVSAVLGTDQTVGHAQANRGYGVFTRLVEDDPDPKHESERNLDLLRYLGHTGLDARPTLRPSEEEREFAGVQIGALPPVEIRVGLSFGAASQKRRWPIERYAAAINALDLGRSLGVFLFASGTDKGIAGRLAEMIDAPTLVVDTSLRNAGAILQRCDAFVGADSGLAHVAAAVDCPCVIVSCHPLGALPGHINSPARFRPLAPRTIVVQPHEALPGCEEACQIETEPHCIAQIEPRDVSEAVQTILRDRSLQATHRLARLPLGSVV